MRRQKETLPDHLVLMSRAIRKRRFEMDVSQTDLAAQVGISNKTLDNIESGRNWPSLPVFIALCRVLRAGKIPLVP